MSKKLDPQITTSAMNLACQGTRGAPTSRPREVGEFGGDLDRAAGQREGLIKAQRRYAARGRHEDLVESGYAHAVVRAVQG